MMCCIPLCFGWFRFVLYCVVCVFNFLLMFFKNFENEEAAARPGSRRERRDGQGKHETDDSSSGGGSGGGKVKLPTAVR